MMKVNFEKIECPACGYKSAVAQSVDGIHIRIVCEKCGEKIENRKKKTR
jgi:ribosomal protein S27AE